MGLVQNCVADIEIGGVAHPDQVGSEEGGGWRRDLFEFPDGEEDGDPQEDDDEESEFDLVGSEKDGRPKEIEEELERESVG